MPKCHGTGTVTESLHTNSAEVTVQDRGDSTLDDEVEEE